MNLITATFAEDKTQAQDVVQIWLEQVFKMKSHDDYCKKRSHLNTDSRNT